MLHQTDHRDSIFLLVALTRAFIVYHIRGLKPFSLHPLLRSERLGLHPDMGGGGSSSQNQVIHRLSGLYEATRIPKSEIP